MTIFFPTSTKPLLPVLNLPNLVILTLVMGGALAYGFIVGDFWKDGGELIENPWGIVSLFDVYVGFFFFIGWIAYRECCLGMTLTWGIAICLGSKDFSNFSIAVLQDLVHFTRVFKKMRGVSP